MNDPNITDDGLLDDLEAEYMAMADIGDFRAIDYALAEAEGLAVSICAIISNIMEKARPQTSDRLLACFARVVRDELLAHFNEVAPLWAAAELPKRVAATQEMLAEWAEEAQAEPPEVLRTRRPAKRAEVVFAAPAAEVA